MEHNPRLKATLLEIVDNQLRDNTPPDTRETYERLLAEGYSAKEARKLIGTVLSGEIYHMLKQQKPYNAERYINALHRLPEMPWE